ncbi:MAG: L-fuculose-phosphate aldolase [Desulfonauticus sp.]|jgi:L-fuculose-phosphate aldolase|nr:L-fuculose-phosphate aldolase [Desulfonauticus sp.]
MKDYSLVPIGEVLSPFKKREEVPKQGDKSLPPVKIKIYSRYLQGLSRLSRGQKVYIFTWLHLASREVLEVHPGGDRQLALHGVFATRSPARPNPIGLHLVDIKEVLQDGLVVHPLEAIDKTPIIDIKPYLPEVDEKGFSIFFDFKKVKEVIKIGQLGWEKGLFSGYNGNISVLDTSKVLITNSKTFKGNLTFKDFSVFDLRENRLLNQGNPSSESKMHLFLYKKQPKARAILHTHPPYLNLLLLKGYDLLELPFFEMDLFKNKIAYLPPFKPGSLDLARVVARAGEKYSIICLQKHGLVVWAENLQEALAVSEEIESLAKLFWEYKR